MLEINKSRLCHPENYTRGRREPITYLVIHYVGALGSAEENAQYYGSRGGIGASAHYFVDHSPGASVWQSVPEGHTAWHCGRSDGRYKHPKCRNANSIGIEMCCHKDKSGAWYFDPETVDRTVELALDIMERYHIPIQNVLRHYDVTGKVCPAPFVEDARAWLRFKQRLEAGPMTEETVKAIVDEETAKRAATERKAPASAWAAESWAKAKEKGVFDGTAPQAPLTREQAACVLDRLGLLN
ncbi:peptidoglycan recognition family protein [Pseudoflavonifractor sp. 524-17]|uniref:peptidoglycan recognition protein family protein n=1 Tax=Pseudoflavonifractor sp. 524-17 TaxID=2304577 RepID=UPI00137AA4B2|nr:peptidoglycan recognition family protein [Pseudoflavonifractor sp. 524-17]